MLQSASRMGRKRTNLVVAGCLFLAIETFAVYSSALRHPFVNYDDQDYVTENTHVRAGLTAKTIAWAFTSTEADNWHPLTWLSHMLDCHLYGLNPSGHHLTNILLHLLNVILLFLILARATGAMGRSLLVAALFAVHPLNVESVAWVAERKNVLSTLFFLLTLGAYGWYAVKPNVKRYLGVAVLFLLGLASKPMVITLPFVLLLLDFWPLERIQDRGERKSLMPRSRKNRKSRSEDSVSEMKLSVRPAPFFQLVLEKLPLLAFCAASAAITIIAQRSAGIRSFQRFSFGVRLENAIYAYASYLWKAFWPTQLAAYYPHPGNTLDAWRLCPAALFLVAVSGLVWTQRRTRPYLVTGWLWYLGTLVPVIGLLQVGDQAMADRYAYIPLIGIFVMVVFGTADWANSKAVSFPMRAATAIAVLAGLSFLTWRQLAYWRSDYDLWSHTLQVTKENHVAEESISKALLREGRAEEAVPGLQRASSRSPEDPTKHANLGAALAQCGRLQDAIAEYQAAIPLTPDLRLQTRFYESLATLYDVLGDYSKVRESYRQALQIAPQQSSEMIQRLSQEIATESVGSRYLQLGLLLQEAGKSTEARSAFQEALRLDPTLDLAQQAVKAQQ
jgi:tetratricopeptide (TPR) repeat protein